MGEIPKPNIEARYAAGLIRAARWAGTRAGFGATLLFAATFLSPQFVNGYGGDDILNACTPGVLINTNLSFADYLSGNVTGWMSTGRFFPIALLMTYGVHCVIPTPALFHWLVFALVLSDLVLFRVMMRGWRVEPAIANLGVLFLSLLFQFRFFFDPILQFAGLLPLLVFEILLALVAFNRYLASGGARWQVMSLLVFALTLMTYEIAFMVSPVYLLVAHARRRNWSRALDATRGHISVIVVIAAYTLGLRSQAVWDSGTGYWPRFDVAAIVETTALQASAALPLSYPLFATRFLAHLGQQHLLGGWQDWLILVAAGALSWAHLRQVVPQAPGTQASGWPLLLMAGGIIWILPGALLALSPKYQHALSLGIGYLPVFLQYFGLALMAIGGVVWAKDRLPRRWHQLAHGIIVFNAVVAAVTFASNRTTAALMNAESIQQELALVESACKTGLCDRLPAGAIISSLQPHAWMLGVPEFAGAHFSKLVGRPVYAVIGQTKPVWLREVPGAGPASPPLYAMNDERAGIDRSYVILAAVEPFADGAHNEEYQIRQFRMFLSSQRAARGIQLDKLAVAIRAADEAGLPTKILEGCIHLADLEIAEQGDEGVILSGSFPYPVALSRVCLLETSDLCEVGSSDLARLR